MTQTPDPSLARDQAADDRDTWADRRDAAADERDRGAEDRDAASRERERALAARSPPVEAAGIESTGIPLAEREHVRSDIALSAEDRHESAVDRDAADEDRRASARARSIARHDRGEAAAAAESALETLETMSDAFVRLDAGWRITYLNPQCGEILHQSPDELLGGPIQDALPVLAARMHDVLEHAPDQAAPVHFEVDDKARGGRVLDCRVLRAEDGLSIYLRDVTMQRRLDDDQLQSFTPVALDLNRAVRNASSALRECLPPGVTLQLDHSSHPVAAYVDPAQLDLVLTSLVINGRDAVGDTGTITITVTARGTTPSDPGLSSGWLQVSDSGCGIPADKLPRIFEPYVASEPPAMGTGPGLAIAHGIVRRSGGFISVESTVGTGTTVTIAFPSSPTVSDDLHQRARALGTSTDSHAPGNTA